MQFTTQQNKLNVALQNLVRNTNTKFEQFSFIRLETKENKATEKSTRAKKSKKEPAKKISQKSEKTNRR